MQISARRNLTGKWTGFWKAFKTIAERMIRKAEKKDLSRIAEILVFDKRMNYRSIFKNDDYSFHVLQVLDVAKEYAQPEILDHIFVYDDGIVKGLIHLEQTEIAEFYVDHFFQNQGIGAALTGACIDCAKEAGFRQLELEVVGENETAVRLYKRYGFVEYGRNPRGFLTRDGRWQELVLMRLELEDVGARENDAGNGESDVF